MASSPAQRPAVEGADRDRMLVLDLLCRQHHEAEKFDRDAHPAWSMTSDDFHAAGDALELDGLVYWRKTVFAEFLTPTTAGLATHAAARRADAPATQP